VYNTTEQFGMKISTLKSKGMAFKGDVPIRSKIFNGQCYTGTSKYGYVFGI
jgi:hypothetical protein